jgi:superoxide dismutase
MVFTLPPPSHAKDALEPSLGAQTLGYHHEKRHAGYATRRRKAVEDTPLARRALDEPVRMAGGTPWAGTPLLTIDSRGHADYLEHRHERACYALTVFDHPICRDFVAGKPTRPANPPRRTA